ncbi:MAG: hypothetical protein IPG91_12880 [Ideonella sp.]|nr:hypothetical protein [Ideonella sp.]
MEAWPAIAQAPASELSQEQVVDMLRRLVEQGKGRTSNKLRTYLRAAYQCAMDVRVSASIPVAFKSYGVQSNPVALTKRDRQFDSADKRPLTIDELRAYWRLIEKLPGLRGRCLRLHLLTGGQRIEQLVRLRWADVRADAITIHDAKGRPGQGARAHTVPITKGAARDMQALERVGDHVFSTTKGVKSIFGTTLSGWAAQVVGDAIEGFQPSASGPAWKRCWQRTASAARSAGMCSRMGSQGSRRVTMTGTTTCWRSGKRSRCSRAS